MKHRSVVANFIFKWSDQKHTPHQVALFRRSKHPNIRSYQDKYAPISGSIEDNDANPVTAAEREILEETQLTANHDLILEFTGQPYSFEDNEAQRSWTVHPFGWILKADEEKIKIDWEHSGWKWFDPQDVLNGSMDSECVPKLGESLRRVYMGPDGMFTGDPPLVSRSSVVGGVFLDTLCDLKTDTKNGARVLATKALEGLQKMVQYFHDSATSSRKSDKWRDLKMAAYQFIHSARPSMSSAVEAAILECLHIVAQNLDDGKLVSKITNQIFSSCINKRKETITKIAKEFLYFVEGLENGSKGGFTLSIFTLSSSSTILAALGHLLRSNTKVQINLSILESRPQCEGADLAWSIVTEYEATRTTLTSSPPRLNIRIVPDSHASLLLGKITSAETVLVLLGADRITPLSNTSNKTGSANLAVLAKTLTRQARIVIVSEEDKIAKAEKSLMEEYEKLLEDDIDLQSNMPVLKQLSEEELKAESHEQHDVQEVSNAWSEQVQTNLLAFYRNHERSAKASNDGLGEGMQVHIDNIYFEFIPRDYIDIFISENGQVSRKDVLQKSLERARLEAEMFEDLFT